MNRTARWLAPLFALAFAIVGAGIVLRERARITIVPGAVDLAIRRPAMQANVTTAPAPSGLDATERTGESVQARVAALLSTLRSGEDESEIQELVEALAECHDWDWVARMIASMPNPSSASYVANRLAQIWGKASPVETVSWIERLPTTIDRAPAMVSAHRLWAEADPSRAASHALQLAATDGRQASLTSVLSIWIQQDAASAGAWIAQCPPDRALDATAAEIARLPGLVTQRPDIAVGWAKTITDEAQRIQSLQTIFTLWAEHDAFAASAYVQTSPILTDNERSRIGEAVHLPE